MVCHKYPEERALDKENVITFMTTIQTEGHGQMATSCGRGWGIRTPDTLRYDGFQDRCIQPLCQPSEQL